MGARDPPPPMTADNSPRKTVVATHTPLDHTPFPTFRCRAPKRTMWEIQFLTNKGASGWGETAKTTIENLQGHPSCDMILSGKKTKCPQNAKNDHITWRSWAFKTSTFGITWCFFFLPSSRLEVADGFHIRWRMLAAQNTPLPRYTPSLPALGSCDSTPFEEGFLEGSQDCFREGYKKGSSKVTM